VTAVTRGGVHRESPDAHEPPEPRHLRSCLSRFVTGVAVVSYLADGEPRGVTVNSFTSVSMDPPLILVSLARTAKAACHLSEVPFTINVLKASQFDIAMQFAGRPRDGLRVAWKAPADGFGDAQRQGAGIGALTSGPAFGGRTKVA
jgi:flavin reductase (DIM6/NTAB) family NADH-FMN oxidoreductase RutF